MSQKLSPETRAKIVEFLKETPSAAAAAKALGIARSTVTYVAWKEGCAASVKRKPPTEDEKYAIVAEIFGGAPTREVALRHQLHPGTVRGYARDLGLRRRSAALSNEDLVYAAAALAINENAAEVARQLQSIGIMVSRNTVWRLRKEVARLESAKAANAKDGSSVLIGEPQPTATMPSVKQATDRYVHFGKRTAVRPANGPEPPPKNSQLA